MHTRSSTCHIHRSYKHAFLCFPPDSHTYPQPAAWMTCSSWATATCSSSRRKKTQIRTMCQLWVFIDEELRTPAVSQQSPFQQEETSDRARLREGQPVTSSLLGPHTVGLVMHLCDLPLSTQRQPGSSLWAPPGWTWNMAPRKHLAAQSSSCRVRRFVIQWPHTCLSHRLNLLHFDWSLHFWCPLLRLRVSTQHAITACVAPPLTRVCETHLTTGLEERSLTWNDSRTLCIQTSPSAVGSEWRANHCAQLI